MLMRDDDILAAAEQWRAEGREVAIATVVETWGSAPRPVGSHLAIDGEGGFLGSVSGGCVEGAVVTEALDVIASGVATASRQPHPPRSLKEAPMLNRDEDILKAAEDWQKSGHGVALATVVETWGSAPRPAGSSLVINDDGTFLGSVSGGCVEGAVVTEALDVIASGQPKMLEFGVADETAWNVGLSCGGTIRVFVEKVG